MNWDNEGSAHKRVLNFDGLEFGSNSKRAFLHGYDFGLIYQVMLAGDRNEIETTIPQEIKEVIERACAVESWSVWFERVDPPYEHLLICKMSKRSRGEGNSHGSRLIN